MLLGILLICSLEKGVKEIGDIKVIMTKDSTSSAPKKKRGRPKKSQTESKSKKSKDTKKLQPTEEEIILQLPLTKSDIMMYENMGNSGDYDDHLDPTSDCMTETDNMTDINTTVNKDIFEKSNKNNSTNNTYSLTDMYDSDSDEEDNTKIAKLQETIRKLEEEVKSLKHELTLSSVLVDRKVAYPVDLNLIDVINGKTVVKDCTDIACWHCSEHFNGPPSFLPDRYNNDTYYVFGCFCSDECAAGYNDFTLRDYKSEERLSLLEDMHRIRFGNDSQIGAPIKKEVLTKFGGPVTLEQFRDASLKRKNYRYILPPMTSVTPIIEESSDSAISSARRYNPRLKIKEGEYRLKRSKPLPNIHCSLEDLL